MSGLTPGERYVFAVSAYTAEGKLIGECVGDTTKPILASHPLPILMNWAYLSQVCISTLFSLLLVTLKFTISYSGLVLLYLLIAIHFIRLPIKSDAMILPKKHVLFCGTTLSPNHHHQKTLPSLQAHRETSNLRFISMLTTLMIYSS